MQQESEKEEGQRMMLAQFQPTVEQAKQAAMEARRACVNGSVRLPGLAEVDCTEETQPRVIVNQTGKTTILRAVSWMECCWRHYDSTSECPPGRSLVRCERDDGCQACWFEWMMGQLRAAAGVQVGNEVE